MLECPRCKVKLKKGTVSCKKCGAKPRDLLDEIGKNSIGMEENVAAASSYAFLFLSGLFFLLIERKSAFVRFHALQSTIALFITFIVNIALAFIPNYGIFLAIAWWGLNLFLIVTLFLRAMAGEWFKLPVIGPVVEKWVR